MTCCGIQTYTEISTGGTLGSGTVGITTNFENASGGILGSGCALVSTNNLYDGYLGIFHLIEQGIGVPTDYFNSTGSADGQAGLPPLNPIQVQGSLFWPTDNLFNGGQYVSTPIDSTNGDYSVTLWAKIEGMYLNRLFFSRGKTNTQTGEGVSITLGHTAGNQIVGTVQVVGASGWNTYTLTSIATVDTADTCWHHFGLVFQSGVGVWLYIDGVEQATITVVETELVPSTTTINFGRVIDYGYFVGEMEEIRYLPSALSAEWIAVEYANICGDIYTVA